MEKEECGQGCNSQECSEQCCSSGCCDSGCGCNEPSMSEKMLILANDAWAQALVQRIKANIEKTHGKKLDSVAAVVAEFAAKYWQTKMESKSDWKEFEDKLANAFKS